MAQSFLKVMHILWLIVCLLILGGCGDERSPYVGEEERQIKALSSDEVEGYLQGEGLGYAKAAELNHYPGPAHVLELDDELQLTSEQKEKTEKIFKAMQQTAIALGSKLVEKERELDKHFASQTVTSEKLLKLTMDIGDLQKQLRFVHLNAHIEQKKVLNEQQITRYDDLRGYGKGGGHSHNH